MTRRCVVLAFVLLGCNKAPSSAGTLASASANADPAPRGSVSAAPPANGSANPPLAEAPLAPPDANVIELLTGLKAGDALGSAEVVEVFGINDGRIPIHISQGSSHAWLEISLRSEEPLPPVSTEHYSVYWTMRGVVTDRMTDDAILDACIKLGERLQTVEKQMPPPEALRKFPKPLPVSL